MACFVLEGPKSDTQKMVNIFDISWVVQANTTVFFCRDVGLPRLTPLLRGLAPSHTIASWACPATLEQKSMT